MADGSFTDIKRFERNDKLQEIREKALNPLITYTRTFLDPKVKEIEPIAKGSFKEVRLEESNKRLVFKKHDSSVEVPINLSGIIPDAFEGISVSNGTTTKQKIKTIKLGGSNLAGTGETAEVSFDWDNIVPTHQERVKFVSGKAGEGEVTLSKLIFAGNTGKVSVSGNELTLTIPEDPTEVVAQIGVGTQSKPIKKILLVGNTAGSQVDDKGVLSIQVPDDGTGGGTMIGNFKGFYENLGTLISSVTEPLVGKSYAFVRDEKYKDQKYYTPYMYTNTGWTEAPVEPAITYESTQPGTPTQGVYSIKPDAHISLDSKGQLDLSRLRFEGHFVGIFDTSAELEAACPSPVVSRSFGYYKTATGAYAMRAYVNDNGTNKWMSISPYGTISAFGKDQAGDWTPQGVIHGFYRNSMVSVDKGVVTIKESSNSVSVKATNHDDGQEVTKDVTQLYFKDGVYVDMTTTPGTAIIEHPQRVIDYGAQWEEAHKDGHYLGNIFYDRISGSWMGYSVGTDQGDITPKWTRIAHRDMSSEVKSIDARLPITAPKVVPGTYGDNRQWEHCGWSYVSSAFDAGIQPESDYKDKVLYILNFARKGPSDGPTDIPSKRMQIGFVEDGDQTEIFNRFQKDNAGTGEPFWGEWKKAAISELDLEDHKRDPKAHASVIKFYKVASIGGKFSEIHNNKGGTLFEGLIDAKFGSLLFDNYGHTNPIQEYMRVPYNGDFRVSGTISVSGYSETTSNYREGRWQVFLRKKNLSTGSFTTLGQYDYNHTSPSTEYPLMKWEIENVALTPEDQLYVHITFSDYDNLIKQHPNLYLVPVRSNIALEDMNTVAGRATAKSFRLYYGNMDVWGNTGFRVHNANYTESTSSKPRSYSIHLDKTPRDMSRIS